MFRRATEEDFSAIGALSEAIWGDDLKAKANRPEGWDRHLWTVKNYFTSEHKPRETTLLAEVEGRVVAAGSVIRNEPRNHIYIHVAPEFRGEGMGEALFETLDSIHDAGPYSTREFGDLELVEMFESLGFRTVERVTEGRIDPQQPDISAWIDAGLRLSDSSFTIHAIDEQDWVPELEVAKLFDRTFQEAHAYIPISAHGDAEAIDFFLGKTFPTLCAFVGEELVGAVTLGGPFEPPFDKDPGAYLSWLALKENGILGIDELTDALIARALDMARQQGLDVHVEAPDIYPHFYEGVWRIPGADLEHGLTILINDEYED